MIRRKESLVIIFSADQFTRSPELVAVALRIILETFMRASGAVRSGAVDAGTKSVDTGAGRRKSIAVARGFARRSRRIETPQILTFLSATSLRRLVATRRVRAGAVPLGALADGPLALILLLIVSIFRLRSNAQNVQTDSRTASPVLADGTHWALTPIAGLDRGLAVLAHLLWLRLHVHHDATLAIALRPSWATAAAAASESSPPSPPSSAATAAATRPSHARSTTLLRLRLGLL